MNMGTEGRKQAWIYCAIDAPEDIHEQLKKQYVQLCSYAEQMGFEPAGSSSDLGGKPLWQRSGFGHFIQAVRERRADTLLIISRNCLSRSTMQLAQLQVVVAEWNLQVFSPMEGNIQFL